MALSSADRPAAGSAQRGLLLVLSANMLLDALEVSAAFVALPALGDDLGLAPGTALWAVGAFAAGFGGLVWFSGPPAARFGRRRVYLAALVVFALASLAGAVAPTAALLIACRVVKGCCAALAAPTGLAIIAAEFPEGRPRERAMAVYTFLGTCGFTAGLLQSGALTELGWRWAFLFPAPVALVLAVAGARLIPKDAAPVPVPVRFGVLRRPSWRRSALGAAALNGSYWGFLFWVTYRLQRDLGWSPLEAGMALLPASVPVLVASAASGRLARRFGTGPLIAAGAAAPPLGYALPLLGPDSYAGGVLPALLLVAAGYLLAFAALHMQAMAGIPAGERVMAGGCYQAAVQLGGVAVLAAATPLGAERPVLVLVTVVGAAGLLVAFSGIRPVDLKFGSSSSLDRKSVHS